METVFLSLSRNELQDIIAETVTVCLQRNKPAAIKESGSKHICGIEGLARLLNCSHPTAQRIKNNLPSNTYSQIVRKIVFDTEAVMSALNKRGVIDAATYYYPR